MTTDIETPAVLTCIECGEQFGFSEGEKQFYLAHGLNIPPKRCPLCRRWKRFNERLRGMGGDL